MTDKRVYILDNGGTYSWGNSASSLNKNCYPPSLLKDLLERYTCYFKDMSRVTEKINDFEPFHPDRLANRILGMGDIVSLVEKASQDLDEEKIKAAAILKRL